ncbi:MAG: hypothetical protein SW833_09570 [Cyanobacteriota bacterium]|nr:hypothetical protein [Cyanobacteriota bacterium]
MPTINLPPVVGKRFFRFLLQAGLITLPTLQFLPLLRAIALELGYQPQTEEL